MFGSQFNKKIYLESTRSENEAKTFKKELSGKTPSIMLTENDKLRANSLKTVIHSFIRLTLM